MTLQEFLKKFDFQELWREAFAGVIYRCYNLKITDSCHVDVMVAVDTIGDWSIQRAVLAYDGPMRWIFIDVKNNLLEMLDQL